MPSIRFRNFIRALRTSHIVRLLQPTLICLKYERIFAGEGNLDSRAYVIRLRFYDICLAWGVSQTSAHVTYKTENLRFYRLALLRGKVFRHVRSAPRSRFLRNTEKASNVKFILKSMEKQKKGKRKSFLDSLSPLARGWKTLFGSSERDVYQAIKN